jgi:hypothetical protein
MFVIDEVKCKFLRHYTLFQDICNRRIQIVYSSCLVSFRMLEFCGSLKNLIEKKKKKKKTGS